jgi:hypothetical protein
MGGRRRPTLQEYQDRVWSRVRPAPPWECWEWVGGLNADGYGQIGVHGRMYGAHRIIYQWTFGMELPRATHLDHICRNPRCVNPSHVEPVTTLENQLRGMEARGVLHACPHGHPYTPENTYWKGGRSTGKRQCRTCDRESQRRYRGRHPERFPRSGTGTAAGERHGMAKLTSAQVEAIRARYSQGEATMIALATEYGVSRTCISDIIRRKRWAA